jgi:hypothetical protein
MNEASNAPLARIAQTISNSAPALAAHVVRSTQAGLERDAESPGISACLLLMKVAAADMQREFAAALQEAARTVQTEGPAGSGALGAAFSLEPAGGDDPTAAAMQQSSEQFARLLAASRARGVAGIELYGKAFFVTPLQNALAKARIDDATAARIMPYACVALDAALQRVYAQMEQLAV